MKIEGEIKSFCSDISTKWNKINLFSFVFVGKHLILDKKLIQFALIEILSTILIFSIPNHHFLWIILLLLLVRFLIQILDS